ncbi:MAG: hypothetical protein KBS95_06530 [Alistipes sp.]|nr:hypothetical protein [Candidatus Alistipes equi]
MAKKLYSFLLIAAVGLLVGCFHKETTDTEVFLKVLIQEESGSKNTQCDGIKAYAYALYDERWSVESYEDALNGVITSFDGEKLSTPDVIAEEYVEEQTGTRYMKMYMEYPLMMIVAVDTQHKMYAYAIKHFEAINLPQTYLSLVMHLWKKEPYSEGNEKSCYWRVVPPQVSPKDEPQI